MSAQAIHSQVLLGAIRYAEALRGQTCAQYFRHPAALRATPARRHKRNRQESKARARWMGLYRFYRPESFHTGEYGLAL